MKTPTIKDIRAAAAARKAQKTRRRRLLGWVIGGGVVVGILATVVVPRVVRQQVERGLATALARPLVVEAVETNLLTLGITIRNVAVQERDGGAFLRWDRLHLNLRAWSLLRGRVGFDAIELDGFEGRVAIDAAGQLNFSDLLVPQTEGEEEVEGGFVSWEVGRLQVSEAKIEFADASRATPFATTFGPVSFSVREFHTRGDPEAPYSFNAVTESGEQLSWSGTLSLTPLRSTGRLALVDFQLKKYEPYYRNAVGFRVQTGALSAKANYELAVGSQGMEGRLGRGELHLADVGLSDSGESAPSINLARMDVTGIEYASTSQQLIIGALEWVGGQVVAKRGAQGIDLQRWFEREPGGKEPNNLAVKVSRLGVRDVDVRWRDETPSRPVAVDTKLEKLVVMNLDSTDLAAAVAVAVEATSEAGGHWRVTGETGLVPFHPALAVAVEHVAVAPLSPYLEPAVGARLAQGNVTVTGSMGMVGEGLVFRGEAALAGIAFTNGLGERLAGWEDLQVKGLNYSAQPTTWSIESIRWIRPDGRLQVRRDGTLNWSDFGGQETPVPPTEIQGLATDPTPADRADESAVVRVDRVELVEAQVEFTDESLPRVAELKLTGLSGTLRGLSSLQVGQGAAELTGMVDGMAPVTISGDFNPLGTPAYTNLKLNFERMDMRVFDGYLRKYGGYQLERGRLALAVDFKLEDRAIRSTTVATLDGFELGEKISSPEATKLPVGLAVALLKDRAGKIVIDLPVEGELDDPKFRIGRVVGRVLTNLLTKAATAPFALLGAAFGGSSEDYNTLNFTAGQATLTSAEEQKLATLGTALLDRPNLRLELSAGFDAERDGNALRPQILEQQLRVAMGETMAAPESWTPGQRMAALVKRYLEVFGRPPIDPTRSVPLPTGETESSPPVEEAPVPAEDQSLLGWLMRALRGDAGGASKRPTVVVTAPPSQREMPAELPALPAEEIAAQLLAQIQVEQTDLIALAEARGQAVIDALIERGLPKNRLLMAPVEGEDSEVKLKLF